jgi:hypothetical protein
MLRRLLLVLAAASLLLLPFADCMSAVTVDQPSMQCCASMPCTPANHNEGCCEKMISTQSLNMLPASRVSLDPPAVATIEFTRALDFVRSMPIPLVTVEAQPNAPPELYTLYASLLI